MFFFSDHFSSADISAARKGLFTKYFKMGQHERGNGYAMNLL